MAYCSENHSLISLNLVGKSKKYSCSNKSRMTSIPNNLLSISASTTLLVVLCILSASIKEHSATATNIGIARKISNHIPKTNTLSANNRVLVKRDLETPDHDHLPSPPPSVTPNDDTSKEAIPNDEKTVTSGKTSPKYSASSSGTGGKSRPPAENDIHGKGDSSDSEELGTDYDFVLDLDEQEDFDRLLAMLSRSGPAKHEDEQHGKPGPSSTFIDRHDELAHPPPSENSQAEVYNHHHKAHKVHSEEEGSHFDDLEQEKVDEEQRRLEQLYFRNIQKKQGTHEENGHGHFTGRLHSSASRFSVSSAVLLLTSLLVRLY